MTDKLDDPILEAAAKIIVASQQELDIIDVRQQVLFFSKRAKDLVDEAGRQIDALRASGHLPKEITP